MYILHLFEAYVNFIFIGGYVPYSKKCTSIRKYVHSSKWCS